MNAQDIPRLLREVRRRTGLTQEKLAAKLGVAFPTLNRWENARAKPSPLALRQIDALLRDLGGEGGGLLRTEIGPAATSPDSSSRDARPGEKDGLLR